MSPEPSLTAARLLAAGDDPLSLYLYLLLKLEDGEPEVLGEALRGLRAVPGDLLGPITRLVYKRNDDVVLLGLCDLAIEHEADAGLASFVRAMLAGPERLEVLNYLVTAVLASHRADLVQLVLERGRLETVRARLRIFADALELARGEPEAAALLDRIRAKLRAKT